MGGQIEEDEDENEDEDEAEGVAPYDPPLRCCGCWKPFAHR